MALYLLNGLWAMICRPCSTWAKACIGFHSCYDSAETAKLIMDDCMKQWGVDDSNLP